MDNIDKIVEENKQRFFKIRENGLLLSDENINILQKYSFNYLNYHSLKELLFDIEQYLNNNIYEEELDKVAEQIQENIYYNYTNK